MVHIIVTVFCVAMFALYLNDTKKNKLDTRTMVLVGIVSAMTIILGKIQFISYPQGGGITLFHMLPIVILTFLCGRTAGLTAGLVTALLSIVTGFYFVHPAQLVFEATMGMMVLGLAGIFGTDSKGRMMAGCAFATLSKTMIHFITGGIYFAEFAPEGMNPWFYSFLYNFSTAGVESVLTVILLVFVPVARFEKALRPTLSR